MLRFLLPAIGLIIILSSIVYFLIFFNKPTPSAEASVPSTSETDASPVPLSLSPSTSPLPQSANANEKLLDTKISSLEKTVNSLVSQVAVLNQKSATSQSNTSTTPAASSTPTTSPAVYITLGSGGESNDQGYTPLPGFVVSLNPTDFPGYTNVTLEATVSRVQPGGTANLQLLNQTTGQALTASTLTTSSTTFQLISSSPFQLTSGTNTYALTMQSSDNTNVQVNVARLKVNFD